MHNAYCDSSNNIKNAPGFVQECFFFDLSIKLWVMLPASAKTGNGFTGSGKTACGETERGKTTRGFFTRGNSTDGIFICGDLPKSENRTMVKKVYSYIALGGNSAAVSLLKRRNCSPKAKERKKLAERSALIGDELSTVHSHQLLARSNKLAFLHFMNLHESNNENARKSA